MYYANQDAALCLFFSKALLRHPLARSELSEFTGDSHFQWIIPDPEHGKAIAEPEDIDDDPISSKNAELARLEEIAAGLPQDLKLHTDKLSGKPIDLKAPTKDKSGVIYISRVPPFMKPTVLRSLLTPYGSVGRIFLTPEDTTSRQQRLRGGGTRRKLFLDGWVEFTHKRDAKFVS